MDKRIILAVAGSGKTTHIIDQLNEQKRVAIITYTQSNQNNLKEAIIKKFGYYPSNIHIFGYFEFVYSFCLVPNVNKKFRGIIFDQDILRKYYKSKIYGINGYAFSNKIAKFLILQNIQYIKRINKYFDELYIDEIQDFNSFDLDWACSLVSADIPVTLVGDYYQKTFVTSRLGTKGTGIKTVEDFKKVFTDEGFVVDEESLSHSYRCPSSVCDFVRDNLNIEIYSHRVGHNGKIRFIEEETEINQIFNDNDIKKLFYQKHYDFKCNSSNWGDSKGSTFKDVCVVLNPSTLKKYKEDELYSLANLTRLKFYVACTRTANNLFFLDQKKIPAEFKI